jgi:hypothetical protein
MASEERKMGQAHSWATATAHFFACIAHTATFPGVMSRAMQRNNRVTQLKLNLNQAAKWLALRLRVLHPATDYNTLTIKIRARINSCLKGRNVRNDYALWLMVGREN